MEAISLFAGVGGIDIALEQAGGSILWANELDKNAGVTYRENFNHELVLGDIKEIPNSAIPKSDMLLAGFPCQAFSVAGYRKGFEDERGNLFFEIDRIVKEKRPRILFLENVKNLVGHDHGNTFRVILEALETHGYHVKYKVMNAMEYGNIPQNRERIYIVAFLDEMYYKNFEFPNPIALTTKLSDIIDFETKMDEKFYYRKGKQPFFDLLEETVVSKDSIYQWRRKYVRENKSGVIPTLTANMGTGGHNVPIIYTDFGIRKLTPHECFNAMGYPLDYKLPDLANSHLYKQAGNSVVVPVVQRIFEKINEAAQAD